MWERGLGTVEASVGPAGPPSSGCCDPKTPLSCFCPFPMLVGSLSFSSEKGQWWLHHIRLLRRVNEEGVSHPDAGQAFCAHLVTKALPFRAPPVCTGPMPLRP